MVSGNDQHANAGEPLAQALIVRVSDSRGAPVGEVAVSFKIASGWGGLAGKDSPGEQVVTARTDTSGIAQTTLEPYDVGRLSVTAEVVGTQLPAVTFNAEATAVVIEFRSIRSFGNYAAFFGPCKCSKNINTITVPIGTTVRWKSLDDEPYTLTSTSTPPGGATFDSGTLSRQSRFAFVPTVAGTWKYHDRVSGLTATLNAK
jgi:hypothetical protein